MVLFTAFDTCPSRAAAGGVFAGAALNQMFSAGAPTRLAKLNAGSNASLHLGPGCTSTRADLFSEPRLS